MDRRKETFQPKRLDLFLCDDIYGLSSTSFLMTTNFIIIIIIINALFMCIFEAGSMPGKEDCISQDATKAVPDRFEQLHAGKCSPHPCIRFPPSPMRKMPAVHHKLLLEEALQDSPQVKMCFLDLCSMF